MGDALSNFFGDWFSVDGLSMWKLTTIWDYIFFGIIILLGVGAFSLATHLLSRQRTPEKAIARTAKKLKKIGGSGSQCYPNASLSTEEGDLKADLIWVAQDCVYLVKVFHYGYEITGAAADDKWTFICSRRDVTKEPNPVPELNRGCTLLRQLFVSRKVLKVPVKPLVVFAENYTMSRYSLKNVNFGVAYKELRKWRELRPIDKTSRMDPAAVKRVLEDAMTK